MIASARAAVDKTMEEGFMKFANSPSKCHHVFIKYYTHEFDMKI